MIALNQLRADLTSAATWCEIHPPRIAGRPVYGHVFALRSGRTRVTSMVDTGGAGLAEAERVNALAEACLEILGYPPLDFGAQPDRIRAALLQFSGLSLMG